MSSTMEGLLRPQNRFPVPQYYPLRNSIKLTPNCVISYGKRYVWLNHRLGERLAVDLSRCETY